MHRIGRTGRAGASGQAITLCDHEERALLADVERLIRQRIPVKAGADPRQGNDMPRAAAPAPNQPAAHDGAPRSSGNGSGGGGPARNPRRYRGARIRPIY